MHNRPMKANVYLNSANGLSESELDIIFDILLHHCIDVNLDVGECIHEAVMHEGVNNTLAYGGGLYVVYNDEDSSPIKTCSPGYAAAIFAHRILNEKGRCSYCII